MKAGRPGRSLGAELAWGAAVVAAATAPFLAVLVRGRSVAWFDSVRLYAPVRTLVVEALRAGRLPLWNPYEGTGMPLLAQGIHSVLHPWSIATAWLAPVPGVDVLIVLHAATGALGAAVLTRVLGGSRATGAVAGITYGLSGYCLSMARNLVFLAGAGTAPWVVAALVAARRGRTNAILAALGVAVAHFAGDPQWSLAAVGLGVLLAWSTGGRRGAGVALGAVVAGTLLAGIQLAPSWSFLRLSARAVGLSPEDRVQWALAPVRLVELVVPGFFAGSPGDVGAKVFQLLGGPTRYPDPFVYGIAIGSVATVLAIAGIGQDRASRMLAGAAVVFVWAAMGHWLGASELLGRIPVLGGIRYAEKWTGPTSLVVSVLAGLGAQRVLDGSWRGRVERMAWALAGVAAALSVAAVASSRVATGSGLDGGWGVIGAALWPGLVVAAIGLACLGVVLAAVRSGLVGARWTGAALAALVAVQGWGSAPFALHAGNWTPGPTPISQLRQALAVPRILTPLDRGPFLLPPGLDDEDGQAWLLFRMGAPAFNVAARVDQMNTYSGVEPAQVREVLGALLALGPGQLTALRRYAVSHVVVPIESDPGSAAVRFAATSGGRRVGVDAPGRLELWSVPHRPWASFAPAVREASSPAEATRILLELARAGSDAVVVEGRTAPLAGKGTVHQVERLAEQVRLVAEAEGEGTLVVADAHWPGWTARIDGNPVEILRADGLVRAIRWPAGRHALEMTYDPAELRLGVWLSAAGILATLALALWVGRTSRTTEVAI